ncbi:penicillin-binding transpeptidase domain-containing protein [Corynebacterium liangguodongii]|uniref:Penicillin-binding protein n=1 Tax=Corynebacterium liangguodongii TaxID=2079535 RepID=A0A2S0WBG6_9CORY|nr:penicillin-binding transpeptidase domain-containing protein [Corynebacterium liangguodongii]AWB83106.1 penicillin-binding protein [Corynebacterium liangguodongii]PWB99293.1 penicillin-binding protein 2 [Corynebacterium liangguodongii]
MNKSIRLGAVLSLLLTVALLVNLTVVQGLSEEKYAQDARNARTFIELKQVNRGQINAGGQVLADSEKGADELYQRLYPTMPYSFGPVLGYVSDQFGVGGLEAGYNADLNGDGAVTGSRFLRTGLEQDKAGNSIELTLDPQMQALAYEQLSNPGYRGAVVAIRPSTGAVLAMASAPSYDPNLLVNPETAPDAWAALNSDPAAPMLNHATAEQLPPGSIFKIVTTAAGLRSGYSPDSTLTGEARITLPGTNTDVPNYGGQACGGSTSTTLRTAFALSCNTAFVQMGLDIGPDALREAAQRFGIGEDYDLGVPTASGSLGELPGPAELGQSAIGQRDVTMTALQAAVMAASVANGGKRMAPYVVDRVLAPDLKPVRQAKPRELAEALTPEEAETITQLMYGSERSTFGYDGNGFASKTGTAEHGEGAAPHVWYVAFDPNNDVAVAVVVKDGGNLGVNATGGQVASSIGRAVLRATPASGGTGTQS